MVTFKIIGERLRESILKSLGVGSSAYENTWENVRKALAEKIKQKLGQIKVKFAKWLGVVPKDADVEPESVDWTDITIGIINKIREKLQLIKVGLYRLLFKVPKNVVVNPDNVSWSDIVSGIIEKIKEKLGLLKVGLYRILFKVPKTTVVNPDNVSWADIISGIIDKIKEKIGLLKVGLYRLLYKVPKTTVVNPDKVSWADIISGLIEKIKEKIGLLKVGLYRLLYKVPKTTVVNPDQVSWSDIASGLIDKIKEKIGLLKVGLYRLLYKVPKTTVVNPDQVSWADIASGLIDKIKEKIGLLKVGLYRLLFKIPKSQVVNPDDVSWATVASGLVAKIKEKIGLLKIGLYRTIFNIDKNVVINPKDATWAQVGQGIVDKIKEKIGKLRVGLAELLGFVDENGKVLEDTTWSEIGRKMIEGITSAVTSAGEFLKELIMGPAYKQWVEDKNETPSWFDAFNSFWDKTGEGADSLMTGLTNLFVNSATFWVALVGSFVTELARQMPDFIKQMADQIKEHSSDIANDLVTIVNGLLESIPPLVSSILSVLTDILNDPNTAKGLTDFIDALIKVIGDKMPGLIEGAVKFIQEIGNWISDPATWENLFDTLEALTAGIGKNTSKITGTFINIILGVLSNPEIVTSMMQLFMAGVVQGLLGVLDALVTAIAGIFDHDIGDDMTAFEKWGVYDWVNKAFGIETKRWKDPMKRPVDDSGGAPGAITAAVSEESTHALEETRSAIIEGGENGTINSEWVNWVNYMAHALGYSKTSKGKTILGDQGKVEAELDKIVGDEIGLEKIKQFVDTDTYHNLIRYGKYKRGDANGGYDNTGSWDPNQINQLLTDVFWQATAHIQAAQVNVDPEFTDEAKEKLQATLNSMKLYAIVHAQMSTVSFPGPVEGVDTTEFNSGQWDADYYSRTGKTSNAKGLWSVPYDNFRTRLHRDEMVLTASQARDYREGLMGGGGDIVAAINGLRNDMQNLKLVVGQKVFGAAVVDYSGQRMKGYIGRAEDRLINGYGGG